MKKAEKYYDPYLRRKKDYRPSPGLGFLDQARSTPGPVIPLNFELGESSYRVRSLARDPDEFLCSGACCGVDRHGVVRHLQPGLLGFVGFVIANEQEDRVSVKDKIRVFIRIPESTDADRGKEVFAFGPAGPFSLNPSGGYRIGFLRFKESGSDRCSVAVVDYNDDGPRDLRIS